MPAKDRGTRPPREGAAVYILLIERNPPDSRPALHKVIASFGRHDYALADEERDAHPFTEAAARRYIAGRPYWASAYRAEVCEIGSRGVPELPGVEGFSGKGATK